MRPMAVLAVTVPSAVLPAAASGGTTPAPAAVVLAVAGALIVAILLTEAVAALLRAVGRRRWLWAHLARRTRGPLRVLLAVLAVWVAVGVVADGTPHGVDVAAALVGIAAGAWLLAVVVPACVDAALGRHRTDAPGHRQARGSRAQAAALRRAAVAVVVAAGGAGLLGVLPATRPAALVLAALVALALVAAVAAVVPWLRDVAAGVQLAATDAVRLDDVVSVDGVWGRVEEITTTSVVVQAWDDRRVVVPARRLTSAPFENWTRRSAEIVGTVELDLEPGVPVADVRAELLRVLEANDLWDRRLAVLQVVDATGDRVRVRAAMSAADAPRLADLACDVREALVEWRARQRPGERPPGATPAPAAGTTPTEGAPSPSGATGRRDRAAVPGSTTVLVDPRRDSRLFTGSVFAVERSRAFTGPGPEALAERDAAVEG